MSYVELKDNNNKLLLAIHNNCDCHADKQLRSAKCCILLNDIDVKNTKTQMKNHQPDALKFFLFTDAVKPEYF